MQVISSKDNQVIKNIKKLKDKKYRDLNNEYIIEGIKLIKEAIDEGVEIKQIIICEECVKDGSISQKLLYEVAKYNIIAVSQKIFESITEVKNPQGIIAVVKKNNQNQQINYDEDLIVILDNIQDPGNLGTILRTVDSANLSQIIVSENTADNYNPKVVRSTMGAVYRVKVIRSNDLIKTVKELKKQGYEICATSLEEAKSIYEIDYKKKVIIIGNEANGVSKELLKLADKKIKIPMLGKTESLNASVATSIIVYEYIRQKLYQ